MIDKKFIDSNYLLTNKTAIKLYNNYAKKAPIIDYHCHLSAEDIYQDKKFKTITEVWLGGDHYKWRLMRANGVEESFITGNKTDEEKFIAWAKTLPYTIGNPLYLWSHLELKTFFGINEILNEESALKIYDKANERLKTLTARSMITMNNVDIICTTDDPVDTLKWHQLLNQDQSFPVTVLPAFRPDKVVNIDKTSFVDWLKQLEKITNQKIDTFDELLNCLEKRIDYFHLNGCRLSDHAIDESFFIKTNKKQAAFIFEKKLNNQPLMKKEIYQYKTYMMTFLGGEYAKRGWTQQYHLSALRNASKRMFDLLGPDTGNDAINDNVNVNNLMRLLNLLDESNNLPKTILYGLNPGDNEKLAVLAGCFQAPGVYNKVQLGAAWWFNDQKDGIIRQMTSVMQTGLLSKWVGMLTDSRSFLSYPRHDYFRRILCSYYGEMIENNEIPNDLDLVGKIIYDISYQNALNFFLFPKKVKYEAA